MQGVRISNGKKKGEPNKKNGNPYLSWAFHEAAHFRGALSAASQALLRTQGAATQSHRRYEGHRS
jgi:hypothetical protein